MQKSTAPEFRRKYPRLKVALRVTVLVAGKSYQTETCEVGELGLSFLHSEQIQVGQQVAMVLYFSQMREILNVLATVKSSENEGPNGGVSLGKNGWRTGVQFEALNFNSSTKLRRFITGRDLN